MRRAAVALMFVVALAAAKVTTAQAPAPKSGAAPKATAAPKTSATPKATAVPKTASTAAPTERPREVNDKPIRAAAAAFVKAYNDHDAKVIAALFTADGEIVDEAGDARQGRGEIEAVFGAIFDEYPEAKMTVAISAVRMLGANLAEEDGVASVTHMPGTPAEDNRYTVLYLKQDDQWLMASARDLPEVEAAPADKLKPLAGLIGEWLDESPESLITTTYRWDDNKNFILGEFTIRVTGRPVMNGSQRIGWDPLAKVIRSWVFDSEGGFAEGLYSRDGDRFVIKLNGVTREGEPATMTNVITFLGKDRISWQSRDRTVGGEASPDIEEVIMVRPPPKPQ